MDINSINSYRAQMGLDPKMRAREVGQPAPGAPASAAQTSGGGDKINLSFDGVLRTTALSTAMNTQDIRQEKVSAIKQSLADGSYTIDNRKIATKLLQDERAIFGR